jgi:hypothetical protein
MEYIIIDKFLIWQIEEEILKENVDVGIENYTNQMLDQIEEILGIEHHIVDLDTIIDTLDLHDNYLFKVVNKHNFLFAVIKYNLKFTVVDIDPKAYKRDFNKSWIL